MMQGVSKDALKSFKTVSEVDLSFLFCHKKNFCENVMFLL